MLPQILEGAWEEIRAHDAELTGHRVRLTILSRENPLNQLQTGVTVPNEAMLAAMRDAEKVQEGMNPKLDSDSVSIIREGRAGVMYGNDANNQ